MPRIPTSEGPSLREQALQGGFQRQIDTTAGTRALAQGLAQVGDTVDKFAKQQAETEAWNAQDEIYRNWRDWYTNETKVSQGEKAVGLRQRADAWWASVKDDYSKKLSPLAQQLAGNGLAAMQRTAYDNATAHETQQLDIANTAAFNAGMSSLAQSAISATPEVRAATVAKGVETIRARAAEKGVDASPDELKWTTGVHTNVIGAMVQTDPAKARQYFTDNRAQIDATQHDNITKLINTASAAVDGNTAADEIWQAGGPKSYAEPVSTDKLLAEVNKRFANDPERRKAAEAGVKDRIAAHNQAQQEYTTAATNTVYQLALSGMNINQLKTRPEWQALVALNGKAAEGIEYQMEQRALHRAQTADALEGAELKRLQRQQHLLAIRNWDTYAKAQDPEVLAGMTRPAIQALAPIIGQENTDKLLAKKDKVDKPEKVAEAKIDNDQFNAFVEKVLPGVVGKKKPTQEEKLLLIQMRNNVETTLDRAQQDAKRPLTRDEKDALIQREVNRTVTVPGGLFSSDRQVPAIALTPDQRKTFVIPLPVRERAVRLMNASREAATTDAMRKQFEPTAENLRNYVADNYMVFFPNGQQ